jgi:hypothetical protein
MLLSVQVVLNDYWPSWASILPAAEEARFLVLRTVKNALEGIQTTVVSDTAPLQISAVQITNVNLIPWLIIGMKGGDCRHLQIGSDEKEEKTGLPNWRPFVTLYLFQDHKIITFLAK